MNPASCILFAWPNPKEPAAQVGKAVHCPASKPQQQQFQLVGYRAAMLEVKEYFISDISFQGGKKKD